MTIASLDKGNKLFVKVFNTVVGQALFVFVLFLSDITFLRQGDKIRITLRGHTGIYSHTYIHTYKNYVQFKIDCEFLLLISAGSNGW